MTENQQDQQPEHEHTVSEIYSIPDRVISATLVRGAQVTKCACGKTLKYEPRETLR